MALDLALDSSHDLYLESADLALVAGVDEVVQKSTIGLKLFRGEWLFNEDAGVPYYQDVLVKAPNITIVEAVLRLEILSVEEIEAILEFNLDYNRSTRRLDVDYVASSTEGEVEVSEVLP